MRVNASTTRRARVRSFFEHSCAVPLLTAFTVFLVYLRTLAPTVTGEDSGELIAAAYTLGIAHPPGYPLWCVLAHAFTWIPFGEVAWRVNLMSAVFGAATVFLVARFTQHLTGKRIAGLVAGLALGFSREFWEQANIAEVYTLNAFLMMLCLWLVWRWRETREAWRLWAFAVVYGLAMGNHNTMWVVAPFFALFLIASDGLSPASLARYGGMAAVALVSAVAIYAYLPLRSLADPAVDWGNPETMENWIRHVRRDQYAFMFSDGPRSAGRFGWQLVVMWRLWFWEFTPWVGLFGVAGAGLLVLRERWRGLWLAGYFVLPVVLATYVQNFSYSQEWFWVMTVFLIPASLLAAVGVGVLISVVQQPRVWLVAVFICVVSPLLWNWQFNDKSDYRWVRDAQAHFLEGLEPEAIYVPRADHRAFVAEYLQVVEGLRTDVVLGRKYGYVDLDMLPGMREALEPDVGEFPRGRDEGKIFAWVLEHTDRQVVIEKPTRLVGGPETVMSDFLFDWFNGAPDVERPRNFSTRMSIGFPYDTAYDYTIRLMVYESFAANTDRGEYLQREWGRSGITSYTPKQSWAVTRLMTRFDIEEISRRYGLDPVVLNKFGVLYARHGEFHKARPYFEAALVLDPQFVSARENLARAVKRSDDSVSSTPFFESAVELQRILNYENERFLGRLWPPVIEYRDW